MLQGLRKKENQTYAASVIAHVGGELENWKARTALAATSAGAVRHSCSHASRSCSCSFHSLIFLNSSAMLF